MKVMPVKDSEELASDKIPTFTERMSYDTYLAFAPMLLIYQTITKHLDGIHQ